MNTEIRTSLSLGWKGVKELLAKGRKDKSGDFTKGANLSSQNIEIIENELKKNIPETEDLKIYILF